MVASVELTNVPPGLRVTEQSVTSLEVRVRGRSWIPDSVGGGRIVARFDLRAGRAGLNSMRTSSGALDLPPSLVLEGVSPASLPVHLARVDEVHRGAASLA